MACPLRRSAARLVARFSVADARPLARPALLGASLLLAFCVASPAAAQTSWAARLVGPHARAELAHPDAAVRRAAVERLAVRGEARRAVTALIEQLATEEDAQVRLAIFAALARRGDPAAVEPLAAGLADWGVEDRTAALRAVGAIGGEAAIALLVEWLEAADAGEEAVDALAWIGAPAVPHVIRALGEPTRAARAAEVLGRIGDARATEPLVGALQGALPAARVVMIRALGEIGDERAAPAVAGMLGGGPPEVVASSLEALGLMGASSYGAAVVPIADRGPPEQRAAALRTLAALDPTLSAPRALDVLADPASTAALRRAVVEGALTHPGAASVPVLEALLDQPEHRVAAAESLSRVPVGEGLASLLAHARRDEARALDPALALGVRRHADGSDPDLVGAARAHLRADPSARGAALAAAAGDPDVLDRLAAGLASAEARERASAALGLLFLRERAQELGARVAERLVAEDDAGAFRALALAALTLRAPIDPARIDARWWDAATAPEACWLAAQNLSRAAPRTRSRLRRRMRRSLRAPQPRVRAGAAIALALADERTAWRALVGALEDPHDAVRFAVARALASLAVAEASDAIAARARIEPDPRVRAALRDAARSEGRRPPPMGRGREVLYVHIATAPGLRADGEPAVDVLLPDGRWLRAPSLPGGDVLIPDLMAGRAEVQVRLRDAPP